LPQVKKHKLFTKNLLLSYHLSFFGFFSLTIVIFQIVTIARKMRLARGKKSNKFVYSRTSSYLCPEKNKNSE